LSVTNSLPRVIQLQTLLYTKQKELADGLRNKMTYIELKAINEEIKKLREELSALRNND
jgi:hypothetical protein